MKYSIDQGTNESAYIQLYHQIRKDITDSVYKYGEKLPSKRLLSAEAQTSVITVEHAYGILADEGYIESRERSGYFVTYREKNSVPIFEKKVVLKKKPIERIKGGETFPFSVFSKTMRDVITKYGEQIYIKSPNLGSVELREAIADYLGRGKGIKVSKNQIVIGSGAEYLYGIIVQILGRDKVYGVENPSYEKIRSVYTANNVECDFLEMGNDGILSSELIRTKAEVLHVTPFKSYPSGITAGASKRREYIEWAKSRNGIIIEDDFDSEFTVSTKNEDTIFSIESDSHVIYVNTFSKTVAPSMRIGYMVLPKNLAEEMIEKIEFYSCTVPVFEQYLLSELIKNGDFERHINRVRRKRRQALKNG